MKCEYKAYQDNKKSIETNESNDSSTITEDVEDTVIWTLTIRKRKCPEAINGQYHKLVGLAWHTRRIETVLETEDDWQCSKIHFSLKRVKHEYIE